jgi:molecular chaperone DnaK
LIEARNAADNAIYTAEKTVKDLETKLPENLKTQVQDKVVAVRSVMDSEDKTKIQKATEELMQAVSQLGAAAYQAGSTPNQEAEPSPQPEPGSSGPTDQDVVDGEFTEEA